MKILFLFHIFYNKNINETMNNNTSLGLLDSDDF